MLTLSGLQCAFSGDGPRPYKSIRPGEYIAQPVKYDGWRDPVTGDEVPGYITLRLKDRKTGAVDFGEVLIMPQGLQAERMKAMRNNIRNPPIDGKIEITDYPFEVGGRVVLPVEHFRLDDVDF